MTAPAQRFTPAPLKAVTIEDRFWQERIRVKPRGYHPHRV